LILVVTNHKSHQALTAKQTITFPEFVYITLILNYVSASNCSLNRWSRDCCFYRWFSHGKSGNCKKLPD